jgi:penicillin-binding protein 2
MLKTTDFSETPESRPKIYYTVLIIAFVILGAKLWYLQIIQGAELQEKSNRQQVRHYRIPAARGIIYDRYGAILAENRPSFNLFFHPEWLEDEQQIPFLEKTCEELQVDFEVAKRRLASSEGKRPFKITTDISREKLAWIETRSMTYGPRHPLEIQVESIRVYPKNDLGAHMLGYCAEIDRERLKLPKYEDYLPGDLVGKTGIEEAWEEHLAGRLGRKKVEVNARNVPIKVLEVEQARAGMNLLLNLDIKLTKAAARAIGNRAGAVVALDPRDGSVLAIHSSPSFSPEMFSHPISNKVWQELINNKMHPLSNKYLQNLYPPGSTFKPFTALAGLESGVIKPRSTQYCSGKWYFGRRNFRCHAKKGHGFMNLHLGIVKSCDVYFYKMGFETGIDVISEYAKAFGFGEKTGIDIVGEKAGTMPNKEWKIESLKERWLPGDTLNASIGQGYVLATPMQVAVAYAALANGGTVYRPQVVHQIIRPGGEIVRDWAPDALRRPNVNPDYIKLINKALVDVVNNPGGTGTKAKMTSLKVAGKTGTSQVRGIRANRMHWSQMKYEHRDHAWFACFAPADNPEIVVVVLAEHSGHGGTVAAPVAKSVLTSYFRLKKQRRPLKTL